MSPTPTPKLRTFLTNAQKLQLKAFWSEHPDLQLSGVADWVQERFGVTVGRATLYRISHAPAASFAGNARQKKRRSVKFPALERDVLAFYEENRERGTALSDEALLQAAAELRERHRIPETELKLSNGWLYRFKERHTLRTAPQARGERTSEYAAMHTGLEVEEVPVELEEAGADDVKRKPRTSQRRSCRARGRDERSVGAAAPERRADSGGGGRYLQSEATGLGDFRDMSSSVDHSMNSGSTTVATLVTARNVHAIQPLTYLSATAVRSMAAVGFVKWKPHSGMQHDDYFSVDIDGVAVLRNATYQLNVELQHSAVQTRSSPVIFKVWGGVDLLGQCERSVRSDGGRALSVLQLECSLPAHTVVRVEYHAPGATFSDSRLVMRLLNE